MGLKRKSIPVVALRGSVVFPHTEAILAFGRPKTKAAVNAAFSSDRLLAIFTQKDARISNPAASDLYKFGTLGMIKQLMPTDNEIHVIVQGLGRIELDEVVAEDPFLIFNVNELDEPLTASEEEDGLSRHVLNLFEKAVRLGKPTDVQTVMGILSSKVQPGELADQIAHLLDVKTSQKQELLESLPIEERLRKIAEYLSHEVGVLELEKTISTKTQKRFEEQMKRAILQERRRTIEQELKGLGDEEADDEIVELRRKIKQAGMSKDVRQKAEKELNRLAQMSPHNPEGAYIRNYLDWLVEMPWNNFSPNNISIKNASKILDQDHYALKKAKERILEFLAVMHLKGKLSAEKTSLNGNLDDGQKSGDDQVYSPAILCFIGPPGVGKTSIGKSIAKALGRKFVRVSLGGVRDEAEIRGHRRTYVGALPGRIIQGIKNAGTKNPIFMLDEIDKLGSDFRGDPSSALLEALDPEQNKEFSDHYLEVPFDLSQVMFICTGNVLDTIPYALRDRMEIIVFPGYTEEEKFHIAKEYLWPKQVKNHGIEQKIAIVPAALKEVVNKYTREAGVRNLERNLAMICRKLARMTAEGKKIKSVVTVTDVQKLLGPRQFSSLIAENIDQVGIATGLAVSTSGGDILFVETALMPGKGRLTLTGQLGEVMKESATAAFSYARSHWREFGLKQDFAKNLDVHIHVPEGAVPKDGPSAGIAMATTIVSALTNTKTRRDVGMTGEITLRGRVLEIGGVKEKVIAAHRAGLKIVILPKDNRKDLEEIPDNVKKDIKFVFVDHLDQVLDVAFRSSPFYKKRDRVPYGSTTFSAA